MSWIAVRKFRDDDAVAVQKSAKKFAERHNIEIAEHKTAWLAVLDYVEYQENWNDDGGYLRRLWEKCFARAVGIKCATGVAWGNIGYPSKD